MNFVEFLTSYNYIMKKIYSVWNNAIINQSCEAKEEINRHLTHIADKMIYFEEKTAFYRARIVTKDDYSKIVLTNEKKLFSDKTGIHGFKASEMGAPPIGKVKVGRANRNGSSYLYLASDKATACAEVQPVCDDLISVAQFKLKKAINFVDLRNLTDDLQEFTDKDSPDKLVEMVFYSVLVDLFCMPVKSYEEDMYRYSQYASDYFLESGVQGILYNSSRNNSDKSYNIVIFDPSKVDCISEYGEAIKCISTSSKFQSVTKNYHVNDEIELLEAKKDIEPYNWATAALLYRDISEIIRKEKGSN